MSEVSQKTREYWVAKARGWAERLSGPQDDEFNAVMDDIMLSASRAEAAEAEVARLTAELSDAHSELSDLRWKIDDVGMDMAFHPRAAKLMRKRKPFVVVAFDEPYYMDAYDLIRDSEMQKGTWTVEDQWHYDDANAAHRARVGGAS